MHVQHKYDYSPSSLQGWDITIKNLIGKVANCQDELSYPKRKNSGEKIAAKRNRISCYTYEKYEANQAMRLEQEWKKMKTN